MKCLLCNEKGTHKVFSGSNEYSWLCDYHYKQFLTDWTKKHKYEKER